MVANTDEPDLSLSRRKLLAAAGLYGAGAAAASLLSVEPAKATPVAGNPDAPPVAGLHLQFGTDASSEVTVSWHTLQPVLNPRVLVGTLDGKLDRTVPVKSASYIDAKSKQAVYAHHAKIADLKPDTAYLYGALHDGAAPEFGTFRTSPRGRAAVPA